MILASTEWVVGIALGVVVIAVAAATLINDSGVRILHSARALRKVAVGK
jgi:hypothetical protein